MASDRFTCSTDPMMPYVAPSTPRTTQPVSTPTPKAPEKALRVSVRPPLVSPLRLCPVLLLPAPIPNGPLLENVLTVSFYHVESDTTITTHGELITSAPSSVPTRVPGSGEASCYYIERITASVVIVRFAAFFGRR